MGTANHIRFRRLNSFPDGLLGGLFALPTAQADPVIGKVIEYKGNTYCFGSLIGEGSFGRVYACVDQWRNPLAAKILHAGSDSSAAIREFQNLLTVRHPKITHVFGAFEYNGQCFIITERCGDTIRSLFLMNHIDTRRWMIPIARCVLQAVGYMHDFGMVHKDLHAGNMFIKWQQDEMTSDPHAAIDFKVGDLGIANLAALIDQQHSAFAQWMLAPECCDTASFGPIDRRVDIYHLGLLLLSLWHRRELRFTPQQMIDGIPRQMAERLPSPYNRALPKALRRHVGCRTQTTAELWGDLVAVAPTQ